MYVKHCRSAVETVKTRGSRQAGKLLRHGLLYEFIHGSRYELLHGLLTSELLCMDIYELSQISVWTLHGLLYEFCPEFYIIDLWTSWTLELFLDWWIVEYGYYQLLHIPRNSRALRGIDRRSIYFVLRNFSQLEDSLISAGETISLSLHFPPLREGKFDRASIISWCVISRVSDH